MIHSLQQLFSNDQAITATAISENVIDLGAPGTPQGGAAALVQDYGKGTPIPINAVVTEAFNNLTSLAITLEVADDAGLTTNATVLDTDTILLADLVAGKKVAFRFIPENCDQRYLGLRFTVTGTAPTTGKIHSGITMGNTSNFVGV